MPADERWLQLSSGDILKLVQGGGAQSQWSMFHWHYATKDKKKLANIIGRHDESWRGWHQLIWPNHTPISVICPPGSSGSSSSRKARDGKAKADESDIQITPQLPGYVAVTSTFSAILAWGAGALRRSPAERSEGSLMLYRFLNAFLQRVDFINFKMLRFDGTTVDVTLSQGFFNTNEWLRGNEADPAAVMFCLDFEALARDPEYRWINGHASRCEFSSVCCLLLANIFKRKGIPVWRSVALFMIQQIAAYIDQPGVLQQAASYEPRVDELQFVTEDGNLKNMDTSLKRMLIQEVLNGE